MAFGINMIDINGKQRPPCTQFEIELDWETLIRPKDKPIPYLILIFGIIFTTLLFVIAVKIRRTHLSTAVAWREKKDKHFVFNKYFSLVLGLLKSRILEKINQALLNKHDFKLFHYKARIRKITTIATRNRRLMKKW